MLKHDLKYALILLHLINLDPASLFDKNHVEFYIYNSI